VARVILRSQRVTRDGERERRMAERGREKGRRTAADTERKALARSGTDRSGNQKKRWPQETAAGVNTVSLARGIAWSAERGAKRAIKRRGMVTFDGSASR